MSQSGLFPPQNTLDLQMKTEQHILQPGLRSLSAVERCLVWSI